MKKILFLFTSFFILFSNFSCEKDESLDPRPLVVNGNYVRLDITEKFLNLDKPNDFIFGGLLTSPGNNIKSYELYVRYTSFEGVTPFGYTKIPLNIDIFPYDLKITPQILATTLNVPLSTFKSQDKFNFLGYAFDFNGNKYDFNSLSAVIKTQEASKQSFKFNTKIFNDVAFTNERKPVNYIKFDNYVQ